MSDSEKHRAYTTLHKFTEEYLHMKRFGWCDFRFHLYSCEKCDGSTLSPTIERHAEDRKGDFMGVLSTECASCGAIETALSITPDSRKPFTAERVEHPECGCRSRTFYLGSGSRFEDGVHFDRGAVVAMCVSCRKCEALLDMD